MRNKLFIDTNIFVYAFIDSEKSPERTKHLKAVNFLQSFDPGSEVVISAQVLSEYYSALLKNKISENEIQDSVHRLAEAIEVVPLTKQTVLSSFIIKNRFRYSYWDSLILASALEHNCVSLYSEDMQHEHKIDNLTIINPFSLEGGFA